MRQGLIALAAGCLLCASAQAADIRMPVKAAPKPAAVIDPWNGFYFGAHAGWAWGSSQGDYTGIVVLPAPMIFYPFDAKLSGGGTGLLTGFNFTSGPWLFGLDVDGGWIFGAKDLIWDPGGSSRYDEIELLWTAHARGRFGYIFGQNMIFIAGGGAFAGVHASHYGPTGAGGALWFDTRALAGWTLGGGIETIMAPNWLARLEYLYDHFGSQHYDWIAGSRYSNSDLTLNTIRFTIVYKP